VHWLDFNKGILLLFQCFLIAQPKTYVKPEAAITVFEHLMMGGVSPETCWTINLLAPEFYIYILAQPVCKM
jgi:hypothetical protein